MIAAEKLHSLPSKLRKSLKKLQVEPSIQHVHQFRTRARRLEASLCAVGLNWRNGERALLKAVKPVREKAGKVRDADVLVEFAAQIEPDGENKCAVLLLEHLGGERVRLCRKLKKSIARHGQALNRRSKQCQKFLERSLKDSSKNAMLTTWKEKAAAIALQLSATLQEWPPLRRTNLHEFRLKVKQLRYVVELAGDDEQPLVESLGEVKDAIGEWHDWQDLAALAKTVIQHPRCGLLKQIRGMVDQKFDRAITLANRLRKQSLGRGLAKRPRRFLTASRIGQPVLDAAATLAA